MIKQSNAPVRRQRHLAEKEGRLMLLSLCIWLLSRGLVGLILVFHLEELGSHEFYSVVVNIVLVSPLFGLEIALY